MGVILIMVPWLIVDKVDPKALIIINIAASFIIAIFRKKLGYLIDSMARGKLLATSMVVIGIILGFQSLLMNNTVALLATFFCAQLYIFLYYVTRSSLINEIVSPKKYGKYNGILEIENQSSTFLAGGLTAYFLGQDLVSVNVALIVSALGLILAAFIIAIKVRTPTPKTPPPVIGSKDKIIFPRCLMVFALCSSVPFICVMLLNVIKPIVIDEQFDDPINVLAMTSIFYAVGAICSGLLSSCSFLTSRHRLVVYVTLGGFLLVCLIPIFYINAPVLYISSFFWGLFNGTSRIVWQTVVMKEINNDVIGRFFTKISITVDIIKVTLLGGYWVLFTLFGKNVSFLYLTALCAIGLGIFSLSQYENRPKCHA